MLIRCDLVMGILIRQQFAMTVASSRMAAVP